MTMTLCPVLQCLLYISPKLPMDAILYIQDNMSWWNWSTNCETISSGWRQSYLDERRQNLLATETAWPWPQGRKATRVGVKQVTHLVYPGNGLSIRTHLLFEVTVKAILLRRAWWASPCCLHLKKTSANRNSLGSKLPFHIPTILSARTLNQMSSFHSPSELFASCGTGNNQNIRWWP